MPEWAELWRKTGQRGLLIASYQRLEKDAAKSHNFCGRQSLSLNIWCHQGPCKPSSGITLTLNSHWGRAATGEKILLLYLQGHFGSV